MGRRKAVAAHSSSVDPSILELHEKHRMDLENLTLTKQPFKTLMFFIYACIQYLKQSLLYVLMKRGWFTVVAVLLVAFGFFLMNVDGPHEKHVEELLSYTSYGLWWVALGVASSIGLGSGLHTFVLYLGPHIAFFTIKAMQCGRVDLKTAPYDTIQLKSGPSWLEKDCSEFGPPLYPSIPGSLVRIPLSKLLPQVLLEAILWGIGTALGELPPYFLSRAGSKVEAVQELDAATSKEDGFISASLKQIKRWLLSHAQHLNFFTVLLLASVPNPLFDLAGIMCGQFGIPFWEFFFATLIGKAIIKTHIQTIFIIAVCNNQLFELVEKELLWLLGLIPGFSSMLPHIIAKLHMAKEKYLSTPFPVPGSVDESLVQKKRWKFSFTSVWNTLIWLVLVNFLLNIMTGIAQSYLKSQQEQEVNSKLSSLRQSNTKLDGVPVTK